MHEIKAEVRDKRCESDVVVTIRLEYKKRSQLTDPQRGHPRSSPAPSSWMKMKEDRKKKVERRGVRLLSR